MVNGKGLPDNAEINCINVNDKTVEGIVLSRKARVHRAVPPGGQRRSARYGVFVDRFLKMAAEADTMIDKTIKKGTCYRLRSYYHRSGCRI